MRTMRLPSVAQLIVEIMIKYISKLKRIACFSHFGGFSLLEGEIKFYYRAFVKKIGIIE